MKSLIDQLFLLLLFLFHLLFLLNPYLIVGEVKAKNFMWNLGIQRVQTHSYEMSKFWNLMYTVVTTVTYTILYCILENC